MRITFLGTGTSSGVPMIACTCRVCASTDEKDKRFRSSVWVEANGNNIVIDTTPDFRSQVLRAKIGHLEAILITHAHKDHIAGMDDVRAFNYFQRQPIDIYASIPSQEAIRREFHYAFMENKYPGMPEINLQTIAKAPFEVAGEKVIPIGVMHYKMPVTGFRIGNFSYITDANFIPEEEKEKIKGSEILVLNALRKEKHVSHFNLGEAIALAQELKIPHTYFTHISHQLGLHEEVTVELPEGIHLAYDGLVLELNG